MHSYIHTLYCIYLPSIYIRERERLRILHAKTSPEGAAPLHWKGSPMPFSVWSALEPFQERLQPTWQRCFCQFGWALSYGALPHGRYTNKLRLAMSTFDSISTLENSMLRLAGVWWVDSQYFFWTRAYLNQASKWYVINRKMQKENHVCIDSSLVFFLFRNLKEEN